MGEVGNGGPLHNFAVVGPMYYILCSALRPAVWLPDLRAGIYRGASLCLALRPLLHILCSAAFVHPCTSAPFGGTECSRHSVEPGQGSRPQPFRHKKTAPACARVFMFERQGYTKAHPCALPFGRLSAVLNAPGIQSNPARVLVPNPSAIKKPPRLVQGFLCSNGRDIPRHIRVPCPSGAFRRY